MRSYRALTTRARRRIGRPSGRRASRLPAPRAAQLRQALAERRLGIVRRVEPERLTAGREVLLVVDVAGLVVRVLVADAAAGAAGRQKRRRAQRVRSRLRALLCDV